MSLKLSETIPNQIGKAYKLLRLKNGKLYPPMVANKNNEDTPIGIWLDAQESDVIGFTKTGRKQVRSAKGVKLAYRPGWHLADKPHAPQFNRTNKETGQKEFPEDLIWAECEFSMDINYQKESDEAGINKNGNYQHSLAGLDYVPINGYYKYKTNPIPDTTTWIIAGKMKILRLMSKEEMKILNKGND